MKKARVFYLWSFIVVLGCSSTESTKSNGAAVADSSRLFELPPTVVTQNLSRVTGVVQSVSMIDNVRYTLTAFISSAAPVGSMPSMAEAGQNLSMYPYYDVNGSGSPDKNSIRNQPLFMLMNAKQGEPFKGTIAQDKWGAWMILNAEKP